MQDKSINILSTRPLGITVMEKAKNESIAIDIIFFIETKNTINKIVAPKIHQATTKETAIAFTSMNAAEAVIDFCKAINAEPEWTIYTLGGITHTILKEFFTGSGIFAGADSASQLAQLIIKNEEDEVVFFCGKQRRQELPEMLKEKNISVEEIEVYETIETPVLVFSLLMQWMLQPFCLQLELQRQKL
jgi:uroporphyrinogen-III synthase